MRKSPTLIDEATGVSLCVSPENGGALSSLRVKKDGAWTELLYSSQTGWRGGAPWLFPAVGRSFSEHMGQYRFGARLYPMPIHGFVMDRVWELCRADDQAIVCRTTSDEETRRLYPFDFELSVSYSLIQRGLRARAAVTAAAKNAGAMPFSLGNHLTLTVADPACFLVRAPAKEILELTADGLLSGGRRPAPYSKGRILKKDPALRDLVLGGFPEGQAWAEAVLPCGLCVRVGQREIPAGEPKTKPEDFRFVFYSDGETCFCPEPWLGEPNSLNTGRGLVSLPPGGRFEWELELTLS